MFTKFSDSVISNALSSTAASSINLKTNPAHILQGQAVGAQLTLNPAVIGTTAITEAMDAKKQRENEEAFRKLQKLDVNALYNQYAQQAVLQYNKEHGTNFKSLNEINEFLQIEEYNKKYGTKFTTIEQVKNDIRLRQLKKKTN